MYSYVYLLSARLHCGGRNLAPNGTCIDLEYRTLVYWTTYHYRMTNILEGRRLAWWLGRSTPSRRRFQVRVVKSASLDLYEIKPRRAP
eukprot:2661024-Pleurochrysis_carterae.AAC.7